MRNRLRADRDDRGFTLIELLIVIIIIGILAAIAIPVYLSQRRKGYRATAIQDMKNAALAVETYATENEQGSYLGVDGFDQNSGVLSAEGYNSSVWSSFVIYGNDVEFCIKGTHARLQELELVFRNSTGVVELGLPGVIPCEPFV